MGKPLAGSQIEPSAGFGADAPELNLAVVSALYEKYADDLRAVRAEQRRLRAAIPGFRTQLDDIEAEITYLRVREHRPETLVEIGSLHGWSTTWLLRALRDNGTGHLHTHDLVDKATANVPRDLADGRWSFVHGDARETLTDHGHAIDYLFVDAAHTRRFARWYVSELFPTVAPGVPVSVHDIFRSGRPWPLSEGRVVLSWLARHNIAYFTASRAASPELNRRLSELKQTLRLDEPIHEGRRDPMLFFTMH